MLAKSSARLPPTGLMAGYASHILRNCTKRMMLSLSSHRKRCAVSPYSSRSQKKSCPRMSSAEVITPSTPNPLTTLICWSGNSPPCNGEKFLCLKSPYPGIPAAGLSLLPSPQQREPDWALRLPENAQCRPDKPNVHRTEGPHPAFWARFYPESGPLSIHWPISTLWPSFRYRGKIVFR